MCPNEQTPLGVKVNYHWKTEEDWTIDGILEEVEKEIEAREKGQPSNTNPINRKKEPLMIIRLLQLCYLEQLTDLVIVIKKILLTHALW